MNGKIVVLSVKFKNNYKPKQKNMKKTLLFLAVSSMLSLTMRSQCVTNCSYSLSSVTPSMVAASGPTVVAGDDVISAALPIGFTFTFMCNAYTSAYVSTNGFLSFSAVGNGCCSGAQCPSVGGNPNNYIAASWMDLNTNNGGTITAQTIGTAPNQVYIVTFSNVAYFSGGGVYNGQIKIYQTTNVIEIHTFNSNRGTNLSTTCTQGIMDIGGNVGYPTPGRNSTIWTASVADAYRFTPTGMSPVPAQTSIISGPTSVANCTVANVYSVTAIPTATAYTWALPNGWIGSSTTNTISVTPTSNGIMSVTASYSCGTSSQKNLYITVPVAVTAVSSASALCAGQSATINATGSANTFSWSTSATTSSISVSPTVTTVYSVVGTNTVNGCSNTSATSLVINAVPIVSVTSGAICTGNSFTMVPSGANTYTFSSGTSIVSPTANASYSVTGTSASGCVSSNTAVSTVTVGAIPTVSVTSGVICAGNSFTMVGSGASTYTFSSGSAIVSPTATANYSVTGTSSLGCVSSNTAVSSVTVNAAPSVSVNSGAICAGNSFTMVASGGTTYTFSSGSAVVTPTATAAYTVSSTSTVGCVGSAVSTVTVNALPSVNAVSNTSVLCVGSSATLTANGASTYTWNTTANTAVIVINPTVTTSYTVNGTNAAGCKNIATVTQSVSTCVGLNTVSAKINGLSVYPNPSNGEFTVELNNNLSKTIQIMDVTGRVVLTTTSLNDTVNVNINNLTNGIYFVKIVSNNVTEVIKVVKQ